MRRIIGIVCCVIALLVMASPATQAKSRSGKAPKPFVYEGTHLTPGAVFITFIEHLTGNFTGSCGSAPNSNGVSSTFVELPSSYINLPSIATVKGAGTGAGGDLQVSFWTRDCGLIDNSAPPTAEVPPNTWFIEVSAYFDVNVSFKLTVKPLPPEMKGYAADRRVR